MKKFLLALAFAPAGLWAQSISNIELQNLWDEYRFVKKNDIRNDVKNYNGTPYLNDTFEKGRIILTNGTSYTNLPLRYNIYQDVFEFEKEGQAYQIPKDRTFKEFLMGDTVFRFSPYFVGSTKVTGYLQVLADGPCSLFKKYRTILSEAKAPEAFKDAEPATFKAQANKFFISFAENDLPQEFGNYKEFLRLLPEHVAEMTKYLKSNKLKLRRETEIIQTVEYYNSL
jgi:hypothetical protein